MRIEKYIEGLKKGYDELGLSYQLESKKLSKEEYIEGIKKANRDFGIDNSYLESRKDYKDFTDWEKSDLAYINRKYGDCNE